jgi:pimeloyl-ACP methyl ester carboxylesterase
MLAYEEYGDPRGTAVLYCHGVPSSRVECRLTVDPATVTELGVRVIAPDRPGIGASDFSPARRIVDWPNDASQLLDALGIEACGVVGSSGGSPYALACGALIPSRVRTVGVIGALAPPDARGVATIGSRLLAATAHFAPALLRASLRFQLRATRNEKNRARMASWFPEPDRTLMQRHEVRDAFIACLEEACRQGMQGPAWDMRLITHPWGFDVRKISVPTFLWQGERDRNVSEIHGRWLARAIPGCRATFYPQDAHLSVPLEHQREIYGELSRTLRAQAEDARAQTDGFCR